MGHIFAGWGIELYTKMSRIHEEKHLVSGLLFFYASPTGLANTVRDGGKTS